MAGLWWVSPKPIEVGGTQYITVENPSPVEGQLQEHLLLPPTFPQKALISKVWVALGGEWIPNPGEITEISVWIDPQGGAYWHGNPPGSESTDYRDDIPLYHGFSEKQWVSGNVIHVPPVLFDQTKGDLLGMTCSSNIRFSWMALLLNYEVVDG